MPIHAFRHNNLIGIEHQLLRLFLAMPLYDKNLWSSPCFLYPLYHILKRPHNYIDNRHDLLLHLFDNNEQPFQCFV